MPRRSPFPKYPSEGWLFDEDRALRDLMKGMRVTDHEDRSRPVEAWFGHPDPELREQKYPYITVDLLTVQEGLDRVHRGRHFLKDPPDWWGYPPLKGGQIGYLMEMPTPIDLDYQVASWARNPRHDRQILNQLITFDRLPPRGGTLSTSDRKIRRLDVLEHGKRDIVEGSKRLLSNVFRVRISSEIPWIRMTRLGDYGVYPVQKVFLDLMWKAAESNIRVDSAMLIAGMVSEVGDDGLVVDIPGGTVRDVPYVASLIGYKVGDWVVLLRGPLTSSPAGPSDYRYLVIGINNRNEAEAALVQHPMGEPR